MITIKKQYDFSAEDFFNYLDKQLVADIKKARGTNLPVKLTNGTHYKQNDINVEITDYKRNRIYTAHFKSKQIDITISYKIQSNKDGVLLTFSENVNSYNPSNHNKISNWLYNLRLKRDANQELKKMADNVYASLNA